MREFENFASLLAEKSGEVIRHYFRTPFSINTKPDDSPVTIADQKAEDVMRELIMKEFPDHGILGEEFGDYKYDAEYTWVLDPIDGTLNFVCGGLMFGTLIALLREQKPILGVIHQPILNELLLGTLSETRLNSKKVHVRSCKKITDASLLTTDPYLIEMHQNRAGFEALRSQVKMYRGWGDCYGYLLLAAGCVDIMVDPIMSTWDIMAIIPSVLGAGGTVTDYYGNDPVQGTSLVATSGAIHQQVIEILNSQ